LVLIFCVTSLGLRVRRWCLSDKDASVRMAVLKGLRHLYADVSGDDKGKGGDGGGGGGDDDNEEDGARGARVRQLLPFISR